MAGTRTSLPIQETEVTVLKETLRSQQQLLQKLHVELDVEREASATATNEALSMILRLQGEKAAVKMEASQYKRLAEEKMGHAEESLAIYEDLIYQKEMEISSLEFQIQAYKYKLLSLGWDDLDNLDDLEVFEKQFLENDSSVGEGMKATVRKLFSLPATSPTDFHQKRSTIDGENQPSPSQDLCSSSDAGNSDHVVCEQSSNSKRSSGDFISYREQIIMLDEKVKEISDCKEFDQKKIPDENVESVLRNTGSSTDTSRANLLIKCHRIKSYEDSLERALTSSACSSSNVQDIFEVPEILDVPETGENSKACFTCGKSRGKSTLENRLNKPDLILEETSESPAEDEIDWIKMNNFVKPEKKSCQLQDESKLPTECETNCVKMNNLASSNHEKRLCKLRDHTNADCKSAFLQRVTGVADYESEFQKLNQRVEQLEGRRNNARHEISEVRAEELSLLKDLREQLNSIQSEIRSWQPKKFSPSDDVTLLTLQEAMLHFWL